MHRLNLFIPSPRQFVNFLKVVSGYVISVFSGRSVIWGYPLVLTVEPTDLCNLRCPLCPSGSPSPARRSGKMNVSQFGTVLEKMGGRVKFLQLWNRGEPFLNDDLLEMIFLAKRHGIYVRISTNGHLLSQDGISDRIISSGLDELVVSLDGLDKETYSKYRVGGSLEKVLRGIDTLVQTKRRKRSSLPLIDLQFIVMKGNEDQIHQIPAVARGLGVDRISVKTARVGSYKEAGEFLPSRPDHSRYLVESGRLIPKRTRQRCRRLWYSMVVNWNGDVVPCCFDVEGKYLMGNIFHQSLAEIWKGQRYRSFRDSVLRERDGLAMCRNCTEGLERLYVFSKWVASKSG